MPTLLDTYTNLLHRHDWSYDWSDDHRAWTKGKAEREELLKLQPQVDPDFAIWNAHAPTPEYQITITE